MNYRMIFRVLGMILLIYAELLLLPLVVTLCYGESALPFLRTILIAGVPGALLLVSHDAALLGATTGITWRIANESPSGYEVILE